MNRKSPAYPVAYMFVVTAALSSVVIGFSAATRERVEANARFDFERGVVEALPIDLPADATNMDIHRIFVEQVSEPDERTGGAYYMERDGEIAAYALPMDGRGFWAPIRAVIGIDADMRTVTGLYIYQQSETPGLGGEITTSRFRGQFEGLELAVDERPLRIRRTGEPVGPGEVEGVTGATQTGNRLELLMNEHLIEWQGQMGVREEGP